MRGFDWPPGFSTVLLPGFLVAGHITEPKDTTVGLNKWYVLVNRNSGLTMGDDNFATNEGASVVQWPRGKTQNHK
jgi:hypothetical protein